MLRDALPYLEIQREPQLLLRHERQLLLASQEVQLELRPLPLVLRHVRQLRDALPSLKINRELRPLVLRDALLSLEIQRSLRPLVPQHERQPFLLSQGVQPEVQL